MALKTSAGAGHQDATQQPTLETASRAATEIGELDGRRRVGMVEDDDYAVRTHHVG